MPLREQVQHFLATSDLGKRPFSAINQPVIVGVSGGTDSLALLHVLQTLLPASRLLVAHLNHGLRTVAAADARLVQEIALAWGIPCYIEVMDVMELAQRQGLSVEEAGRQARYQFFARLAAQVGAAAVFVAHNADDQAETVLLHLLRGTGLKGLGGMRPVSPPPVGEGFWLVRPFLDIPRAEIAAYCAYHDLHPVEDASNQDPIFLRNRLRHELLPLLATYNPAVQTHLQQLSKIVSADYDLLASLVDDTWDRVCFTVEDGWLAFNRLLWQDLSLSLRRELLRKAVFQLQPGLRDVTFRALELARQIAEKGETGTRAPLPGGLLLQVGYQSVYIMMETAVLPVQEPQLLAAQVQQLSIPGILPLANGWCLEARIFAADRLSIYDNEDNWQVFVDIGETAVLFVRPRLPGERFQPLGMHGQSAKIKEVMINRKIPARLRANWPCMATADHLVWMVGYQIDTRVRVTSTTQRIVHLRCYQPIS